MWLLTTYKNAACLRRGSAEVYQLTFEDAVHTLAPIMSSLLTMEMCPWYAASINRVQPCMQQTAKALPQQDHLQRCEVCIAGKTMRKLLRNLSYLLHTFVSRQSTADRGIEEVKAVTAEGSSASGLFLASVLSSSTAARECAEDI